MFGYIKWMYRLIKRNADYADKGIADYADSRICQCDRVVGRILCGLPQGGSLRLFSVVGY